MARRGGLWRRAGQKQRLGHLKRCLHSKSAVFTEIPGADPGFGGHEAF